jgi:Tfp pilus assembly protein PilX
MGETQRGAVLGIVVLSSIVFSVAAFAVLQTVMARAQIIHHRQETQHARFAAEAGLVWAMQKLWAGATASPPIAECFGSTADVSIDTDGDGTPETPVDIIVSDCSDPMADRTLQAKVVTP